MNISLVQDANFVSKNNKKGNEKKQKLKILLGNIPDMKT